MNKKKTSNYKNTGRGGMNRGREHNCISRVPACLAVTGVRGLPLAPVQSRCGGRRM